MEIIRWSYGNIPQRSKRLYMNEKKNQDDKFIEDNKIIEECLKDTNEEENSYRTIFQPPLYSRNDDEMNKRETNFNKIHQREQYPQITQNPFFNIQTQ